MKRSMIFLALLITSVSFAGTYSGGSGTSANPYLISIAADVNELSITSGDWASGKYFKMTNDINLPTDVNYITPIGNSSIVFQGTFDGDGYVIRNLKQSGSMYMGLFGRNNGYIKNLGIEDANIVGLSYSGVMVGGNAGGFITNCYSTGAVSGSLYYIGGLVGHNYRGNITACYTTGAVSGSAYDIGGLVGYNDCGSISYCYSTGQVSGVKNVGGLAGHNYGNISNCYSTGTVRGDSGVGGLVGLNSLGIISNCYSTGAVSGSYHEIGGLVGDNRGSISNCYSTGAVSGSLNVGGLVGYNNGRTISNCYSKGAVSGSLYDIGGLVGYNNAGTISNCYSTGQVSGGSQYIGGLVGRNGSCGSISNCYFLDTAGPDNDLGEPLTDAQMKQEISFTGWDFSYEDGNDAVWVMAFDGYPILPWQISDADLYTDGENNFKDFMVFASYWLREDCRMYNYYCEFADMDFDRDVDIDDLAEFMSYWLEKGIY